MSLGPQNRRPPGEYGRPPAPVVVRRRIMVFGVFPGAIALLVFGVVISISAGQPTVPTHPTTTTTTTTAVSKAVTTVRGVGVMTVTYVDPSRSTKNYTTGKTTSGRTITAEIRYETAAGHAGTETPGAPVLRGSAHPVIVFAPGFRHRAEDYEPLLDDWVSAGYVVVALGFPDTTYPASDVPYHAGLPNGSPETDLYNEPGDVSYVLAQLAKAATGKANWLRGLIDPAQVFLAGHSDGGTVIAAFLYDDGYTAVPGITVRGAAILSGAELPISGQTYAQPSTPIPMLVVQSAADTCNAPAYSVALYNAVAGPKYFLELLHANHINSYNGADPASTAVVAAVTTAFFNHEVGVHSATRAAILRAGTDSGVSSVTAAASVATIPAPAGAPSCPAD